MRIALIGCGKVAEKHMQAYTKIEGIEVVVTDIVDKGEAIAEKYGFGWSPNPAGVIKGDFDAVDVCTPTPSHYDYVHLALLEGKHVFCEKPLADVHDTETLLYAEAEEFGKILQVGYLYRYHSAYLFAKKIVDEERIGRPYYAIFRLGARGNHKAWKHMWETGGGVYDEVASHLNDLSYFIFGMPLVSHTFFDYTVLDKRTIERETITPNAEDLLINTYTTESGTRVVLVADMLSPGYMNYTEIHGINGSLFTSILEQIPTILYLREARGGYSQGYTYLTFRQEDLFEKELRDFVEKVNDKNS